MLARTHPEVLKLGRRWKRWTFGKELVDSELSLILDQLTPEGRRRLVISSAGCSQAVNASRWCSGLLSIVTPYSPN